jgi:hypothetical protein
MATKARIENGIVVEVLTAEPFPPFHKALVWVDCGPEVEQGWQWDGERFAAPAAELVEKVRKLGEEVKTKTEILRKICDIEAGQNRAIREAILTGDKSRLEKIEAEIAELRKLLASSN